MKPLRRYALVAMLLVLAGVVIAVERARDIEFELGYLYESGRLSDWAIGPRQDYGLAASWFARAANAGHARAQYRLGILYAHGWGVIQSNARALACYEASARTGYAVAQYHLGWIVHNGDGTPQDFTRARALMQQAAAQGMAAASLALGHFYQGGDGAAANPGLALRYYEQAYGLARDAPTRFDNASFERRARLARDAQARRIATGA
jgi:TPR repeat protein